MLFKLTFFIVTIYAGMALELEENNPDGIPKEFYRTQSGVPGGYENLTDTAERERIKTFVQDNIEKMEAKSGQAGGVHHRLLNLHDTIEQQDIQGKNIKVVFDVGQAKANEPQTIDENGQYGKCYFRLYLPSNANKATLQEYLCMKMNKSQLDNHP